MRAVFTVNIHPIGGPGGANAGGLSEGEANLETGIARLRFHSNVAAMFSNDAGNRIQPESGAFANWLCCKKRLEYSRSYVLWNSVSVITNFD